MDDGIGMTEERLREVTESLYPTEGNDSKRCKLWAA